ncbi:MAG TPA: TylF/MycF/NovP-related O-methyltransferase [Candidatus Binataceae bacterium]|nr:TylF/MycF/NovP-related O-methyltransferase [Candidatus Binataceae bacterium]
MTYEAAQRIVSSSKILRRLTLGVYSRLELLILKGHKSHIALNSLRRCRRGAESLLSANESFLLYSVVCAQSGLGGAMAEVGVYQGTSAQIICEAKRHCPLYLFDTFSGLPQPGGDETRMLKPGQYAAQLSAVRTRLAGYSGVHFCPGIFPQSAVGIDGARFSLVHLDADLYTSTLAGLEYFYPRMIPGGIIIAHDYSTLPGVMRAFAEFLKESDEAVIELPSTQAMIVVGDPARLRRN